MRIEVDCATAKVVEATPAERDWLRGYLTFNDPQARFTNGNPIIDLLDPMTDTFPAGFALKAWRAGATRTHLSGRLDPITIELVDVRTSPPERRDIPLEWLRDYQRKAVETALARTRGLVQISTGGGKTECMAALVASVPDRWLILVPQSDLLEQTAERIERRTGERPGLIGDGQWDPKRVTVATFQTLSRRMSNAKDRAAYELMRSVHGIIVDECFPAGTLVGSTPIEQLRAGDWVPSFDEKSRKVVMRRVVRTFRKKPASLVSVHLADGRKITCTEEHPFFVSEGEWLPAKSISGHHVLYYSSEVLDELSDSDRAVYSLPNSDPTQEHSDSEGGVLHALSDRATGGEAQEGSFTVSSMRSGCDALWFTRAGESTERSQLLRDGTQAAVGTRTQLAERRHLGEAQCCEVVCPHEGPQSDAYAWHCREDASNLETDRTSPPVTGWEWQGTTGAPSDDAGCTRCGLGCGTCDNYQKGHGSAERDQVGLGASRNEACGRGGRRVALHNCDQRKGCAENRLPQLVRVDRVEVHEQGSDGGFGQLCPDGHVYNIEVEDTHTYLVDGVVVHNCHQVASGTFNFVLTKATSAYYRIGFSATPLDRSDRKSIFVIAQLGGIIHRTTSAELRALGMLADAKIKMVRVEQGSTAPTWPGVYGECVVRSKPRNAVVAEMARQASKPALVFVSQVGQGRTLLPMIQKLGMRAALVWGEDDTDQRRKALKDLVEGRLDVIVCSSVFQQAVDIPSLASVVNGAGGSSVIQTLQRIGRGTRVTKDKKTFEVWDVLDDGHRWLRKHGAQRKDVYESEGYKVEVLDSLGAGAPVVDTRKDEHGFVMGSAAQAAHRASVRREALQQLTGLDVLKNPRRGKILRPHQVVGYGCTVCGAPNDCLPPECPGYMPEEAQGKLL
jgi:superfamily II DNA or RNA helicase